MMDTDSASGVVNLDTVWLFSRCIAAYNFKRGLNSKLFIKS